MILFCDIIWLVECENYVGWVIVVKVCKKCKGHVANKTRICKYCGADVSKAKIIKNVNNTNKYSDKKKVNKSKTLNVIVAPKKQPDRHVKTEKQNVVFDKINKIKNISFTKLSSLKKRFVRKNDINENKSVTFYFEKIVKSVLIIKNKSIEVLKFLKLWSYKGILKLGSFLKWLLCAFDRILDFISEIIAIVITKLCKFGNIFVTFIFSKLFWILKTTIIFIKNVIVVSCRGFVKIVRILGNKIKAFVLLIKSGFQKVTLVISSASLERKRVRKLKKQEKLNNRIIVRENKTNNKHTNNDRNLRILKPVLIISFVLVFLGTASYIGINVYSNFKGTTDAVVVSEKATREKIFAMNDVITYNGVDYKIVKVETSNGNSYKSPKEGNQFLIVTVYIKNNTNDKVPYSYENWTMSNSKGEEKKRIFTSINVNNALYSGELVIGGIKTGSMVFEQPINDSKLILNFYDLKKDDNGNDIIDDAKREFSVSVKVPSGDDKNSNNDSDVKVMQTTDKIKN